MKRILSALLTLCLIAGLLPAVPMPAAAAEEYTSGYYTYEVTDGETTITDVDKSISGDITIPSIIGGYPVTTIGASAFYNCYGLTSVAIPDSIITIGNSAFEGCSGLTAVYISDIAAWCSITFSNYDSNPLYYAKNLYLDGKLVTNLVIPDSVTSIGNSAFSNCTSLISITIPDSVTSIGNSAFKNCTSLTSITIPDSITTIGSSAFEGCTSLTSVTIPDSVTTIGDYAFSYCQNLTTITIPDSVTTIGGSAFFYCESLTDITIPDSITTIGNCAFEYCTNLTSITIPDSVTTIGDGAFSECTGLTSITISYGVTTIGNYAFYKCTSLTSVTIPDSVTTIGYGAFYKCTSLTSVTIPDSVTTIGYGAFSDCGALETVYYTGTEEQWKAIHIEDDNDALLDANIVYNYKLAEPEYGEVEGWNLILKENIGVQFQISFSEEIQADEKAYVEITVAGETRKIPVVDALEGIAADVAPAQMTEDICITIVSGDGAKDQVGTYTVRSYADYILAGDYTDQTKMMVKYMLAYGAAAQKYFGYNESALANEGISCNLAAVPTVEETAVSVKGTMADVAFYGASLRYDNKIALRYYFTGDAADCTFTANGKKLTPVEKDGRCYVEIGEILPQDLDESFSVTVTDSTGSCLIATYSPMNYIVRMYHKADATQETKDLLQALYTYHYAAEILSA